MNQMTIQDLFSVTREDWLDGARATARKLLDHKESITIEDVLKEYPRPTFLHKNVTGSVFNREFTSVGFARSTRAVSKGRVIQKWKLSDEPVPSRYVNAVRDC